MKTSPSSAAREISHWRNFFRTRDAALHRAHPDRPGARPSANAAGESEYAPTEWAETEWPDTDIEPPPR